MTHSHHFDTLWYTISAVCLEAHERSVSRTGGNLEGKCSYCMKRFVLVSAILALSSLNLGATLLSTLVAGGSLSNANITVDNFTFIRTCGGTGVCAPLDASGIDVTLVGNQLHFAGGFTALNPGGGFATADFLVGYDLLSVPAIGAVGLLFNGAVVGDSSFAQVVETVIAITPFLHVAGQGQVDAPSGPLADAILLDNAYHFLKITKDIFLVGSDTDGLGYASISLIDQFYVGPGIDPFCTENCEPEVPEPGTYALMGVGLVGIYLAKRRRVV